MAELLCRDCMVRGSKALLQQMNAAPPRVAAGRPTVRELVMHAAAIAETSVEQVLGRDRHRWLSDLRRAVVIVAREASGLSYSEIGRRLGGRDHSTTINLMQTAGERMKRDPAFAALTERLWAAGECSAAVPVALAGLHPPAIVRVVPARRPPPAPRTEPDDGERFSAQAMVRGSALLLAALRREHAHLLPMLPAVAAGAASRRAGYCREAIA